MPFEISFIIWGIMNHLQKFLPSTTEVYEPMRKLTSPKCEWTWSSTYQNQYNRTKNFIKKNATMAFYNEKEQLYLETDALGIILGESLLQVRVGIWLPRNEASDNPVLCPIAFASKSLSNIETDYSNMERESLGIFHGLEKFATSPLSMRSA